MNLRAAVGSVCVFMIVTVPASAQSLREARTALQKGNYAEAQELYQELVKDDQQFVKASLGLSQALEREGKSDNAIQSIDAALKKYPKHVDLLARKAELLFERGQWDTAEELARQAVASNKEHLLGRWVLAQLLRDRGNWEKADEEFRWFVRYYSQRSDDDKEITNPEELRIVGLAGLERARYHRIADQFEFILQEVFDFAVKEDKLFWQSHYESGRLYLEKHNKGSAAKAFDRALAINPRAAEVFAAKGLAAFTTLELKDAEIYAEQALAINPNLIDALRVKAAIQLFSNETGKAETTLARARSINPCNESILATLAATRFVQKKSKEFDAIVKEVAGFNPKAWRFYTELAAQLEAGKRYYEAEGFYKTAAELEPKMPDAHDGLGGLYMRMGRETEARKVLTEAFDADPFNVRVANSLKVLDHLGRYEEIKTPHYLLRYDPKNDDILARAMIAMLEDLHKELAKKFDYHPKEPFLIEVFNKHEMFSGRVTALPDLHTIGACTGRIMAMVSTHDKSRVINKRFNWVRVLRHEVVHLFNLDQTNFQCPHWLTEGLAVTMEGKTTPLKWNYLLAEKLRENDLLNLDNILLGFARPRSPDQWQQAYLQSQLYVEYITKTHGEPAIGKLLAAYAKGMDNDAALPEAIGDKKADFEKGYRTFIEERVRAMKLPEVRKSRSLKALREAREKNPDDADIAAQLAEKQYQVGNGREAIKIADEALALKVNHPLAAYVKAAVLVGDKQLELALATLSASVDAHPTETKALKLLAKLQYETKSYEAAAATSEKGRALEPLDETWLVSLARVYTATKNEEKLMEVLEKVSEVDPDDLISRKKLMVHYHNQGKHAQAERFARGVMEIDVKDTEAHRILLDSLQAQNKDRERDGMMKIINGE